MSQLAVRETNGAGAIMQAMAQPAPRFDLAQMWQMAEYIAASGLFGGCKMPEQAFTLMLICDAENLHPIQAMRRYHIIPSADGPRPSMRSDAMQAEFQGRGGVIKIIRSDTTEARALFSHPTYQPEPVEAVVTYQDCVDRGITRGSSGEKKNWRESREAMLWARLVTKMIRKIYPGIVAGIYSPEEIEDMQERPALDPATRAKLEAPAPPSPAVSQVYVPGFTGEGYDARVYKRVAGDAAESSNRRVADDWSRIPGLADLKAPVLMAVDVHRHVLQAAIQHRPEMGPFPAKIGEAVTKLDALYKTDQAWVREAISACVAEHEAKAYAAMARSRGPVEDDGIVSDPDDDGVASSPAEA